MRLLRSIRIGPQHQSQRFTPLFMPWMRPQEVRSDNPILSPTQGLNSTKELKAFFYFLQPKSITKKTNQSRERKRERRKWVRTMSVLYSELQVPGWAETGEKIGLYEVTGTYDSAIAFTLPCHNADPELFFSESDEGIAQAKALCGGCPVRNKCLDGALSRQEPCGVWGGQLIEDGVIIERKRRAGRPPRIAAFV
jgi:WhiB family redox-sensing transcriptional regulator